MLTQLQAARAEGDLEETGNGLLALAHLVKWVGSDTNQDGFTRSHDLATEALECFRQAGSDRGQVRALVAASAMHPNGTEMLEEAERTADRLGDLDLQASVVAARARAAGLRDRTEAVRLHQRALDLFRQTENLVGQANALFGLAIAQSDSAEQVAAAKAAAKAYREAGDYANAARSGQIALSFDEGEESLENREATAKQGLADAQRAMATSLEQAFYEKLALIAAEKGDQGEAETYRRWATELQDSDGLSPLERWQEQVDLTKWMIETAKAQGHEEMAKAFRAELKRLRADKPE